MKIEIEYSEVARMKGSINEKDKEIKELHERVAELDEDELKEQAMDMAFDMVYNILKAVFAKLGFSYARNDVHFRELKHRLGENWWVSKDLKVEVGATITTNFREALLNLGIKKGTPLRERK